MTFFDSLPSMPKLKAFLIVRPAMCVGLVIGHILAPFLYQVNEFQRKV